MITASAARSNSPAPCPLDAAPRRAAPGERQGSPVVLYCPLACTVLTSWAFQPRVSLQVLRRQVERTAHGPRTMQRGVHQQDPAERPERLPARAGRVLLIDDRDAL